jgi:hypothetical protein
VHWGLAWHGSETIADDENDEKGRWVESYVNLTPARWPQGGFCSILQYDPIAKPTGFPGWRFPRTDNVLVCDAVLNPTLHHTSGAMI